MKTADVCVFVSFEMQAIQVLNKANIDLAQLYGKNACGALLVSIASRVNQSLFLLGLFNGNFECIYYSLMFTSILTRTFLFLYSMRSIKLCTKYFLYIKVYCIQTFVLNTLVP